MDKLNKFLGKLASMTLQKVLILGAILGGIYYMTLFDDGSALDKQIQDVLVQLAEQEKKHIESDKALKEVEHVRNQLLSISDQYKTISTQMPTEFQMAEVLKNIDSMATSSGVSVKTKEPLKIERKDILEEMPIRITAQGKFSELTLYLYNLMNTERISRVTSLTISRPTNQQKNNKNNKTLELDVNIANYRFVGEGPKGIKK